MSELSREEIIQQYERGKKQEQKIDGLNESIKTLNETLGKFMSLLPGWSKEGEKGEKGEKSKVPTKIEDKKEKKEEENNNPLSWLGF